MTTQNVWDAAKAVLRGNFTAIQSYLKKKKNLKKTTKHTAKAIRERRTKTTPKLAE